MAHQFDTGFTVRTPAWHGLGVTLDEYPDNWDEARRAAGLLWEPTEDVIYRRVTTLGPCDGVPEGSFPTTDGAWMVPLVDHKLITRDDTRAELAVARRDFPLISHGTMGDLVESLAREVGTGFKYETGGSLQGGRKVWALARLDEPFTIPGDDTATYPYFAIQNAHDGEGACRIIPTLVRIVCMNTWRMASDLAKFEVVIRHIGNVDERVEQAKVTLSTARAASEAYREQMTHLTGLRYDDVVLTTFLEEVFPTPEGGSPRLVADRAEKRQVCRAMLAESPTLAPLPDTAYKLVQLVGEYADHLRPLRAENKAEVYLRRTMFHEGDGAKIKAHTIDLAKELCTVGV